MSDLILSKSSSQEEIKHYFEGILELSKSQNEFPVNLDEVWMLVYDRKDNAIRELKNSLEEGYDFRFLQNEEVVISSKLVNGKKYQTYLTISALEFFIARKVRPVFEVYRQVFHRVISQPLLPNFNNPAEAARAWANEYERAEALALENKRKEYLIEVQTPKAESFDEMISADGLMSMQAASGVLGYGRNKFMAMLRGLSILQKNNIAYRQYIDRGYFEEKVRPVNGVNHTTTFITPKGIEYLRKKLKE